MSPIELRPDLLGFLEHDAKAQSLSVNDIVNEAVEQYVRERQRAKLDREIEAFLGMHGELRRQYLGQWVAIHDQTLVDHDPDQMALYQRIRARFGRTSVLIRRVSDEPDRDVWLRSPSTGKQAQ
jgi:hypothetical protein